MEISIVVTPPAEPVMAPLPTPQTPPAMQLASKKRTMKQQRAGINFPVGRVRSHMRRVMPGYRLSEGVAVYMAAILEYLVTELLDISSAEAASAHKRRITPRHIKVALQSDNELAALFGKATLANAGGLEHSAKKFGVPERPL